MVKAINEQTFNQEVLQSHIPVVVSFWAPWCGVCRLIEPLLHQIQSSQGSSFKIVRINADENFHLARTYRLKSLPTLLIFEGGELRQRLDPQFFKGDIRGTVQQFFDSFSRQPCLQND